MNFRKLFTTLMVLASPGLTFAQEGQDLNSLYATYQLEIVVAVAAIVSILALIALVTALYAMKAMARGRMSAEEESSMISVKPGEEGVTFWRRFWNRLNDSVPVSNEETIMTDHAYDGIRELDNSLPPWWLYGFYITIIFGVLYVLNYHVFKYSPLQEEAYNMEMEEAEAQVTAYLATLDNLIDETSVTFSEKESDLITGKELFISKCSACHGQNGEGGVGPNLTDKYWLHGGDIKSIFKTIKYGVPSKGMIAWEAQLVPKEMQQVASYIYTLEGTEPGNPKEPQGDLFEREETSDGETDAMADAEAEEGQLLEAGM